MQFKVVNINATRCYQSAFKTSHLRIILTAQEEIYVWNLQIYHKWNIRVYSSLCVCVWGSCVLCTDFC